MKVLRLRSGCRLHFGLMELAADEPLRYAGLGLMLDQPGFELSFTAADLPRATSADSSPSGPWTTVDGSAAVLPQQSSGSDPAEVMLEYERRIAAIVRLPPVGRQSANSGLPSDSLPEACHIRLLRALPMHCGLGAGTQLASAMATGLELFRRRQSSSTPAGSSSLSSATSIYSSPPLDAETSQTCETSGGERWCSVQSVQPPLSIQWLTQSAGRGLRSAIGLYGFLHGGLILDRGYAVSTTQLSAKEPASCHNLRPVSAQSTRVVAAWRIVLITPKHRQAVSGAKEAEWMAELGSLPNPHRDDMLGLAQHAFTLASQSDRFVDFTHCLEDYMNLAGELFRRYQGGLYNGEDVACAVDCARRAGLRGVGQSSWGPTVFGFAENPSAAQQCAAQLAELRPDWYVRVATPAAHAAEYCWQ